MISTKIKNEKDKKQTSIEKLFIIFWLLRNFKSKYRIPIVLTNAKKITNPLRIKYSEI